MAGFTDAGAAQAKLGLGRTLTSELVILFLSKTPAKLMGKELVFRVFRDQLVDQVYTHFGVKLRTAELKASRSVLDLRLFTK
ncbi:hypothetical protein ACU8KH_05237 [Lachancea thermotolerans]